MKYNYFNRASGRLNLDHTVNDRLKIGGNFNIARTQNYRASNDNQFSSLTQGVANWPVYPSRAKQGLQNASAPYDDPFVYTENATQRETSFRTLAGVFADFTFVPKITYHAAFNLDLLTDKYVEWTGQTASRVFAAPYTKGYAVTQDITVANYVTTHFATYRNLFGTDHSVEATGGFEFQRSREDYGYAFAQGFISDDFRNIRSATTPVDVDGDVQQYTFISGFGRLNYSYKERYLLGASFRADASSRFGPKSRWGYFPGVSLGWVVTEEDFAKQFTWLSNLKLRTSYGLTGNAQIGNYTWRPTAATGRDYRDQSGIAPNNLGNTSLTWEKTAQFDAALDFAILNNRISATIEYYNKQTSDLLLNVPIPIESGFNTILDNVGELENKGWEFSLTTQNLTGQLKWTTNILWTFNKNEVTKLGEDNAPIVNNIRGIQTRAQVGYSLGHFFGRRQLRVDPADGSAVYYVEGGGETKDYNEASIVPLGNAYPTSFGSITNTFSYKGIELSAMLYFNFGNSIYWGTGIYSSAGFSNGRDNQTVDQMDRWLNPGDVTNVPRLRSMVGTGGAPSSRLLYDGDFVRLRNVTIAYSLPQEWLESVKLRRVRFYVQGTNLVTWTDYPGEPEISSLAGISNIGNNNTGLIQGIDFYTTPQIKSWTFGVQVGF